ncbi:hypothetical protein L9F63_001330, partial [Diploptera punctata]
MSKDIVQETEFKKKIRKVYYFSKIAGLASFSYNSNSERKIDTSSKMSFIWPMIVFGAMLTGSIYTLIRAFRPKYSAIIYLQLCSFYHQRVPTVNKEKRTWSFLKESIKYFVICVHIGFLLLESWFRKSHTSIYYETLVRVSDSFHMLLILIFNSMTNIIKIKLQNIVDTFTKHNMNKVGYTLKKTTDFARISTVSCSEGIHIKCIRNIRKEYCMAYSLSVEMNALFGFTMLFMIIKYYIYLVYNMCEIYSLSNPSNPKIDSIFLDCAYPLSLFLVTKSCDSVIVKVNTLIDCVQQRLLHDNILIYDFKQLKLFSNQLQQNKIEFSAVGFKLNLNSFAHL